MKKARKGFTLVELLIVVAILAILSAVMTASITGQTAKAKASAILNNVAAFKKAAEYYYADNWNDAETMSKAVAGTVVNKYVPTFDATAGLTDGKIKYTATGEGVDTTTGIPKWTVTVNYADDGESAAIQTALQSHAGYGSVNTSFTVTLYTGAIDGTTTSGGTGGSSSSSTGS